MLQIFKEIISAVWALLCIPFEFDGFSINIWQITLFILFIATMINVIFRRSEQ